MPSIALELTDDQAWALAQMCKRICFEPHIVGLSNAFDGGSEARCMADAIARLERALAGAGFNPR